MNYYVNRIIENQLIINGKGDSVIWEKANIIKNFSSPWDSQDIKKIEFKSLCDTEKLFFCFKVHDSDVHIHQSDDINDSINNSDRVELFFRSNINMNPYYCLEIDSIARIMDFKAKPEKKFDFKWNWPENHIAVKSNLEKDYFTVEGEISLQSLTELGLLHNNRIETGVYRAKYNKLKSGLFSPTWVTWINPKTKTPNFHTSSSFGVFILK